VIKIPKSRLPPGSKTFFKQGKAPDEKEKREAVKARLPSERFVPTGRKTVVGMTPATSQGSDRDGAQGKPSQRKKKEKKIYRPCGGGGGFDLRRFLVGKWGVEISSCCQEGAHLLDRKDNFTTGSLKRNTPALNFFTVEGGGFCFFRQRKKRKCLLVWGMPQVAQILLFEGKTPPRRRTPPTCRARGKKNYLFP